MRLTPLNPTRGFSSISAIWRLGDARPLPAAAGGLRTWRPLPAYFRAGLDDKSRFRFHPPKVTALIRCRRQSVAGMSPLIAQFGNRRR